MDANVIRQLYEQHKIYKGKKLKKFKDANEIKKHGYGDLFGQDEQVIFGFKALFDLYLFTDKAFYYMYSVKSEIEGIDDSLPKRLEYQNIIEWHLKDEYFYINGDELAYGIFSFAKDLVILNLLKAIFSEVVKELVQESGNVTLRKQCGIDMVWQVYQSHRMFNGQKLKYFREPQEIKEKTSAKLMDLLESGEKIVFVIKKNFKHFVFSDKAFYFEDEHYNKMRFAYDKMTDVKANLATGKVLVDDKITELGKPVNAAEVQIISVLEKIICTLIDQTTEYSSLPKLELDDTVQLSKGLFTKLFADGFTAQDVLYAAQVSREVYKDCPDILLESPVILYSDAASSQTEPFMELETGEPLLFKYDTEQIGFYVSDRRFGIYTNGKESAVNIPLSKVKTLTVVNQLGRLFLTINNNDNLKIEIIAPCTRSFAFMLMSLCISKSGNRQSAIINLFEQFKRLRMIADFQSIFTHITTAVTRKIIIEKQFNIKLLNESFVFWTNNRQLILLKESKLAFAYIADNGELQSGTIDDISKAAIDYMYIEVDSSKKRRGTGLVVGLLTGGITGGLAGSMVGYGSKKTSLEYSHCQFKFDRIREQLYDMSPEESLVIRFVIESI